MTTHRYEVPDDQPTDDDLDDEPLDVFFRRQVDQLRARLERDPPTDPHLHARLERDLATARAAVDAATIDEHWRSGEGDRKLF